MNELLKISGISSRVAAVLFCAFILNGMTHSTAQAQAVVASTSLAGAIARAAGAKDIRILTPAEIQHPPEYELKPSDLLKLDGVQVVVYAGYERMVERLADAARSRRLRAVRIDTATSPQNLIDQTKKIAAVLGTEKVQEEWEKSFLQRLNVLKARLIALAGKRAVVHFHAQPFARWAGLSIVQVVPPGELSLKAVADAVAKQPDMVIDILHLPVARVIADNARSRYVQVINFPAVRGTSTLEDIFEFNTGELLKIMQDK